MSKAIGIDLGTTNSCVSIFTGGRAMVIPNQEGSATTPSMVAFTPAGTRLVGAIAKRQILTNPENTIYSAKRLTGRKFDSPEARLAQKYLSYPITASGNGDVMCKVMGQPVSIPEIQAEVLRSMKKTAELYLGEEVSEAVITVPAYFNDAQRQATKDAGLIAGLKVLRIINEPTAASLAYGLDHNHRRLIAVYDLGGGTFDISILEIGDGVFQVKATSGDTFLGGDDFDRRIMDWLVGIFKEQEGHDLSGDKIVLQRLRDAAEEAKHVLSTEEETVINLPFAAITPAGPKHLKATLTRRTLEELTEDLILKTLEPCRQALADSRLRQDAIEEVVMVGGQTRMPRVREVVRDFFGREPHVRLNPDEVVALGAAVQAAVLKGDYEEVVLLDVTPLTLGIETKGNIFTPFIERNTTVPTRKSLVFTTTEDNQSSVIVHVLQGERKMASDNISLAKFELLGLPPVPRGLPKIEVTFDIDANGILSVSAKDLAGGGTQAVRINPSGGITPEEINRIIAVSDENARRDDALKVLAVLGNEAEAAIYTADKLVRGHGAQMLPEQREHLLAVMHLLRSSIAKSDRPQMERCLNELRLITKNILNKLL